MTILKRAQAFFQTDAALLIFLVIVAAVFRLKGITSTPTDWHAFRQADTASVTREYVKHGIDILRPKYQDLSNIQSGLDNLDGYRMVEFPFVNALEAGIVRAFPQLDLVTVSRSISVPFSLGTLIGIFYLGKIWTSRETGFFSALAFAILPYSVYYSRAILPESPFIFFIVSSILFFQLWASSNKLHLLLISAVSFSLAMLLKPFILFLAPVYLVIVLQAFKTKVWQKWQLILFAIIALVPFYFWRMWILQFPSGIPASSWLFNSDGIRFRPAWFRWLFLERLTKLILGWVGIPLFVVGILSRLKGWITYLAWGVGGLAYLSIIATGNVRHDYYQVFLTPIICFFVGLGMDTLSRHLKTKAGHTFAVLSTISLLFAAAYTANVLYIRGYYRTRPDWEEAGRATDQRVPSDAKVIAPAFGDTAFLFQTNRTGWPIGFNIDDKIAKGAQYYVSTAYDDEARELEKKYLTVSKTPNYVLLNLKVKNPTFK